MHQNTFKGVIAHRGDDAHHRCSFHKTFRPPRLRTFKREARGECSDSFWGRHGNSSLLQTQAGFDLKLRSLKPFRPPCPFSCGWCTLSVSNAVCIGVNVAWKATPAPSGVPQVCLVWPSRTFELRAAYSWKVWCISWFCGNILCFSSCILFCSSACKWKFLLLKVTAFGKPAFHFLSASTGAAPLRFVSPFMVTVAEDLALAALLKTRNIQNMWR